MRVTDDNLHGRVVLSADGLALGEIEKLFFLSGAFAIDAVLVKLRKDIAERLGMKHSTFHAATMEIPAGFVQSVGDAVILSAKLDELVALRPNVARDERTVREDERRDSDVHEPQNVHVPR